jgi:hypothetical protein
MCKKNAVFGKCAYVPADCIGCRNTSCRGTGLKVTMNRKMEKSMKDLEGMRKLTESKMEGQSILHLKALIRKTASRCLLLNNNNNNVCRLLQDFFPGSSPLEPVVNPTTQASCLTL